MLMTETPVASHTSAPAASASATPAAAPTTPSTPSSDTTFSALTQNSTPPISAEPPSSATSQPSASASSAGSRTHRIAQGETFASISTAAYGSSKYYPQIIKANPGVDPNHLKVGATITLPDIATPGVRPTAPTATAAPAAATEAQHASARVAATPIDSTKEYRVQQGDSLYKISLKLYGKSDRANKIFELNKQSMGDDPHHLKVSQVLQLPEPPTQTTTASR
jgi:nucleoid-associated protein YgaU